MIGNHDPRYIDFSIVLGMHLPYLIYLDKEWVDSQWKIILDPNNVHYNCRLCCIFSRNYLPSVPFYNFLKEKNIFKEAIEQFKTESVYLDNLLQFAILELTRWNKNYSKPSIKDQILNSQNAVQIKRFVHMVWKMNALPKDELLDLVDILIPLYNEQEELRNNYSSLLWLLERIDHIDRRIYELAKIIIQSSIEKSESYSFLLHLYKVGSTNLELSGQLILQLYERKLANPYLENELETFVGKLFETGNIELANRICIVLAEMGSLSLKQLYNRYN